MFKKPPITINMHPNPPSYNNPSTLNMYTIFEIKWWISREPIYNTIIEIEPLMEIYSLTLVNEEILFITIYTIIWFRVTKSLPTNIVLI